MAKKTKATVYQIMTERMCELLKAGTVPWKRPWQGGSGMPTNLKSGKAYRGSNVFLLWCAGASHGSDQWVTYKQAEALGGNVQKGAKGYPVIFWKFLEDKKNPKKKIPMLRYYTVFNAASQCEGLEKHLASPPEPREHNPIPECEAIVSGFHGPEIGHGEARAYYSPLADRINMPQRDLFDSAEEYYSTLFHELGHSTGHRSRLDRLDGGSSFGSHSYSKEELVAEMSAAFLCCMAGIESATIDNSAAYIQGWLKKLQSDPKLVVQAGAQAQKACDMILGVTFEEKAQKAAA